MIKYQNSALKKDKNSPLKKTNRLIKKDVNRLVNKYLDQLWIFLPVFLFLFFIFGFALGNMFSVVDFFQIIENENLLEKDSQVLEINSQDTSGEGARKGSEEGCDNSAEGKKDDFDNPSDEKKNSDTKFNDPSLGSISGDKGSIWKQSEAFIYDCRWDILYFILLAAGAAGFLRITNPDLFTDTLKDFDPNTLNDDKGRGGQV